MIARAPDDVLQIRDLRVDFQTMDGTVPAVKGVSLTLERGKTLALVGESGSGKSVTSYAVLRIIQQPGKIVGGQILFRPSGGEVIDIASLKPADKRLLGIRGGKIGMIFQEPMTALSPVHTIGNQIIEAIRLHKDVTKRDARKQAAAMLDRVGIPEPERRLDQYPFEFSGGMRQRVVIAMALVCKPEIIIADEPTTALDVTVQAQILTLLSELQEEIGASVLFITHDLGVVAQVADDVVVMQHGRIVERASADQLFTGPYHPYTKRLLSAIPGIEEEPGRLEAIAQMQPTEALPEGYAMAESSKGLDAADRPLKLHRFADGREVLVRPALETQPI